MNFFKIILAVLVALALSFGNAFAYVSPGKPTGYVNDYTGTLSTETKAELENLLKSFKESGAGEISVAMISSLGGDTIDNYALSLGREWGIGQKGKDNGALLLIAKDDRELRIEVGYGFEGVLTDIKSSRIIRELITPRFKEGNYDAGVTAGVKEMVGLLNPALAGGVQNVGISVSTGGVPQRDQNSTELFLVMGSIFGLVLLRFLQPLWLRGIISATTGLIVGYFWIGLPMGLILVILFPLFVLGTLSTGGGGRDGGFSGGGSSFGGFGGGSFGGGGASGRW